MKGRIFAIHMTENCGSGQVEPGFDYALKRNLTFMYAPIVDTLIAGMRGRGGWSVRYYPCHPREAALGLGVGDVLVWVGAQEGQVTWKEARAHGVRTVYYQTEPMYGNGDCERLPRVDEGGCSSDSRARLCTLSMQL